MWERVTRVGMAGTLTGYCSHPTVGRVTRGDQFCTFFVRGKADVNVSFDAFERLRTGKTSLRQGAGPRTVDLNYLRKRTGGF